ncbi:hypothetical protein AX15_006175 [Amanita polypyramis BW_CC]|nr:hypothetical protein AX15_006175 [Amanita polypyramis BW_CC]
MVNMESNAIIITVILLTIVGSLVAMIAQCLYAHRIQTITNTKAIPLGIVTLAILQVAASIAALVARPVFPIYIWIGLTVINDTIIAIIMVRALSNSRGFSHSELKTSRLIRLIVETGCATAVVNILSLTFVALTNYIGDVYTAPLIILSKVYSNAIMVLLNNRMIIVGSRNAPPPMMTVEVSRVADYDLINSTNSKLSLMG